MLHPRFKILSIKKSCPIAFKRNNISGNQYSLNIDNLSTNSLKILKKQKYNPLVSYKTEFVKKIKIKRKRVRVLESLFPKSKILCQLIIFIDYVPTN